MSTLSGIPPYPRSRARNHSVTGAGDDGGVDAFESLLREALLVTAILTLPVLVLATAIGAVVAVLQAATQVQEQTLTLLPKIVAVGLAVALFGKYGLTLCAQLLLDAVARIPAVVRG
jgi:flagellar biosynthetic protein FliQ